MALSNAINFIKQAGSNKQLRSLCNRSNSKDELLQVLGFNLGEFEDAINMRLVKCQTYEEAEEFQQIKMWFSLL